MIPLQRVLAQEQRAFCRRPRGAWGDHLARTRGFLSQGLEGAESAVILGAGSGLEIPWAHAPQATLGWDAAPWSRWATWFRHRRFPAWCFADVTGSMGPLQELLGRVRRVDWQGRVQGSLQVAKARLAGLLDTLPTDPTSLRETLAARRPDVVLEANLLGQVWVVGRLLVEQVLGSAAWEPDPDLPDPLADALDLWTARVLGNCVRILAESGAALWLVHDLAVLSGEGPHELGPFQEDWRKQIRGVGWVEALDPLCGVEVVAQVGRAPIARERWLWPVGPGQTHVMEALAFSATGP